jgi:hypothetical protein
MYEYLSSNLLLFNVFRDPYKSVSFINLVFSIGIVVLFNALHVRTKLFLTSAVSFTVLLLIVSQSYLLGDVYRKSELLQVPHHMNEFAEWNSSEEQRYNSKKLLMPSQPFPTLEFALQEGKGSPIIFQLLNSKAVQNNVTFTPYIAAMQDKVYSSDFEKIVGFYNIPYVVNFKDIDYKVFKSENPEKLGNQLSQTMSLTETFGGNNQIQVYEVDEKLVNDIVYIPSRVTYVQNNKRIGTVLTNAFEDQLDNDFAFLTQEASKELNIGKKPEMRIVSQNNIESVLGFKNVQDNFLLVFNENYSNGWVIKRPNDVFGALSVDHVMANGFTNGYYIDVPSITSQLGEQSVTRNSDGSSNFTVKLYYQPQLYLYAGIIITLLTLVAATVYYLVNRFTQRKK